MPGPLARLQLLTELSPQVVGPIDQSIWFSDGYGDFIRNTMHALAANALWASAGESHILRSSSVVTRVAYGAGRVNIYYNIFGANNGQKLGLAFVPA